jgi:nicotinamide-nucleotide amidase
VAITANNLKQAVFPEGAVIIPNPNGTAPGFRVDLGHGKKLIWLSGVPHEMSAMLRDSVLPWIVAQNGNQSPYTRLRSRFMVLPSPSWMI